MHFDEFSGIIQQEDTEKIDVEYTSEDVLTLDQIRSLMTLFDNGGIRRDLARARLVLFYM